ncbi:MAG: hypothetical protein OEZ36_05835 [Spirochaetota bacterium]|nr:hypothetical protein [Spirochaetota bacterium]
MITPGHSLPQDSGNSHKSPQNRVITRILPPGHLSSRERIPSPKSSTTRIHIKINHIPGQSLIAEPSSLSLNSPTFTEERLKRH